MSTGLTKFFQIQSALKDHAVRIGDTSLVAAVTDCILNVAGGNIECPLGSLALEEYAAQGTIPKQGDSTRSAPLLKEQTGRENLLKRTHELLIRDEAHAGHTQCVTALESCAHYRESNPLCPIFALLKKNPAAQQWLFPGTHNKLNSKRNLAALG